METSEKEAAKKAQDLEADQCILNMTVELVGPLILLLF